MNDDDGDDTGLAGVLIREEVEVDEIANEELSSGW